MRIGRKTTRNGFKMFAVMHKTIKCDHRAKRVRYDSNHSNQQYENISLNNKARKITKANFNFVHSETHLLIVIFVLKRKQLLNGF